MLLTVLMNSLISNACLISPVDPPLAEPAKNHAPQIVIDSVQPQVDGVIGVGCADKQLDEEFSLRQAIDLDLNQSLYVYWFVDYDPDPLAINSQPFYVSDAIPADGEALRELQQSVKVPRNRILSDPEGTHLVEVLVTDARPLSQGPYPNRSLPEGAGYDLFYWIVSVVQDCP